MSDVSEAAERVTRIRGESVARVYNDPSEYEADLLALTEAHLAEHPADDDEPVTAEWLGSVLTMTWNQPGRAHYKKTLIWNGHGLVIGGGYPIKTRGDVRRLCAALGIELKDTP